MDWENERWVKLYTRTTADLILIGWEGRALFHELMKAADSAGVLDTGGHLAVLADIVRIPVDVVERVWPRMVEAGCVTNCDTSVTLPNYMTAQKARQSDKVRQQESRARRRAEATAVKTSQRVTLPSQRVTKSDSAVTPGHTQSQSVTNRGEENRVEESREISTSPTVVGGPTNPAKGKKPRQPKGSDHDLMAIRAAYPKLQRTKEALGKLRAMTMTTELYEAILAAAWEMHRNWQGSDTQGCPAFGAWVTQERWLDDEQCQPLQPDLPHGRVHEPTRKIRIL